VQKRNKEMKNLNEISNKIKINFLIKNNKMKKENNITKDITYRIDMGALNGYNTKCNLNCKYCHKDLFPLSYPFDCKELPTKSFVESISELEKIFKHDKRKRKIHISGRAEPLMLNKNVLNQELNRINTNFPEIKKVLTTNGLLLKDKVECLSNNGIKRINVSMHNKLFKNNLYNNGIITAKNSGIDVFLNVIICKQSLKFLNEVFDFALHHKVSIKFFLELGIEAEEANNLFQHIKYFLFQKTGNNGNIDSKKNRQVYNISENQKIYLKLPEVETPRPKACEICKYREMCQESCWEAIRVTPWYIKPCGVRDDNVYFLCNNSIDDLKHKLKSGGKL